MNHDELIRAALDRRFARTEVPACPEAAWQPALTEPAANVRPTRVSPRFAYAAAVLVAVAVGGLTAQAAPVVRQTYANFVGQLFVSSKPFPPIIHASERLSIAQAQRQIPFTIVEPAGLPAGTQFLYAHLLGNNPVPHVVLTYQAHVASKYYRIAITESTVAIGPAVGYIEVRTLGGPTKRWTLPLRRWKHGALVMDMPSSGLPPAMADQIVRANTQ